jgi:hypothetical protein
MSDNVIAFPQPQRAPEARKICAGAKTLFIHIKQTTMIIHLTASNTADLGETRIGKST